LLSLDPGYKYLSFVCPRKSHILKILPARRTDHKMLFGDLPVPKDLMQMNDSLLLLETEVPTFYVWSQIVCPPQSTTLPASHKSCTTIYESISKSWQILYMISTLHTDLGHSIDLLAWAVHANFHGHAC
jgi:hypothetical protein